MTERQASSANDSDLCTTDTSYLLHVHGVLQRIGVRTADVQDIAQQVFLKIFRNMDKMPTERVPAWIELICRQQAADHYRLHRNRFETPAPDLGGSLAHGDDVHEQFERCEMTAIVKKVLEGLDAPLREVLIRYELQDESLESIAKSLGIVRNTVHARLVEAKRIFAIRAKHLLGEDGRASLLVPLFVGAEAFSDANQQTSAFVEELRASLWHGIAKDLRFASNPPLSSLASQFPAPRFPRAVRRILGNRGLIATASAVAGFVAALLWPRDVPVVAKHLAMAVPVIVVPNSKFAEFSEKAESSSVTTASTTNHLTDAPAPNLVKSLGSHAATLPNSHVDEELRLLEEARQFIANARYAEAIAVLARHQQEFPQSQFATSRSRYISLAQEGQRRAAAAIATMP